MFQLTLSDVGHAHCSLKEKIVDVPGGNLGDLETANAMFRYKQWIEQMTHALYFVDCK